MLNRRILRVKAMQSLYALQQAEEANHGLAHDAIVEQFPIPYSAVAEVDREGILAEKDYALELFKAHHQSETFPAQAEEGHEQAFRVAQKAYFTYRNRMQKDRSAIRSNMLSDTERCYRQYVHLLQLLVEMSKTAGMQFLGRRRKALQPDKVPEKHYKLSKNKVAARLQGSEELKSAIKREGHDWDPELVRDWLAFLRETPEFQSYRDLETTDFAADREILVFLVRDFLFRHEAPLSYFEERDLNWAENRPVVRSLLLKTLRNMEEADAGEFQMQELSRNWEDDKGFFVQLYAEALRNAEEFDALIGERLQNWTNERLAMTDRLLLRLALAEATTFPSIPVKVTINEYIEIAKQYSTPKSWQFINGLLDKLTQDLLQKGRIRKSGRGLLDSK